MPGNIGPLRGAHPASSCPPDILEKRPGAIAPSVRGQLLGIFGRLAVILELTAETARTAGKLEHHAALDAQLAVFKARVEAGETSRRLAAALADFGEQFKTFIQSELGFRRV